MGKKDKNVAGGKTTKKSSDATRNDTQNAATPQSGKAPQDRGQRQQTQDY